MQGEELEDFICDELSDYFGEKGEDYTFNDVSEEPFVEIDMNMSLYNYHVVKLIVERSAVFINICSFKFPFMLFEFEFSVEAIKSLGPKIDEEVRLRIPDKYLKAKGWL